MKSRKTRKLHLSRETVRNLNERQVRAVVGGATVTTCPETGLSNCQCVTDMYQCGDSTTPRCE
jgi:natural product precursor